jgi:DNA-binding GntR family transcriptional regulator
MIYSGGQPGRFVMPADDYVPDYRRVANELRTQIINGAYAPGSKLPTKRELCATFKVSAQTVDSAMIVLREGGWIRGRQGAGVFVANPLPTEQRSPESE